MRMKKLIPSIMLIFCMAPAFACNYPAPPKSIPDGATSSKDEMLAGMKVLAAYQENISAYLSCIEADAQKVIEKFVRQKRKTLSSTSKRKLFIKEYSAKYNGAVEARTRTVELFNVEIRAFKAQSK